MSIISINGIDYEIDALSTKLAGKLANSIYRRRA